MRPNCEIAGSRTTGNYFGAVRFKLDGTYCEHDLRHMTDYCFRRDGDCRSPQQNDSTTPIYPQTAAAAEDGICSGTTIIVVVPLQVTTKSRKCNPTPSNYLRRHCMVAVDPRYTAAAGAGGVIVPLYVGIVYCATCIATSSASRQMSSSVVNFRPIIATFERDSRPPPRRHEASQSRS